MDRQIVAELAPTGVLRAAINMGNFLLVTGKTASGDPQGVAPDMAAEIARRLGVSVRYVPFERPSTLAEAAGTNVWDIGLIGAEPQRAAKITFTDDLPGAARFAVPGGCRRRSGWRAHRGAARRRLLPLA
jgi:polar amino acid transport system substrate-binding protein